MAEIDIFYKVIEQHDQSIGQTKCLMHPGRNLIEDKRTQGLSLST